MFCLSSPPTTASEHEATHADMIARVVASKRPKLGDDFDLTPGQRDAVMLALNWVREGTKRMARIDGFAGTGKTAVTTILVECLLNLGLINRPQSEVVYTRDKHGQITTNTKVIETAPVTACAPTHTAKKLLAKRMKPAGVSDITTLDSFLGRRPVKAKFLKHEADELHSLNQIEAEDLSENDELRIETLRTKEALAAEGKETFEAVKPVEGVEFIRLLIVDEWSMISKEIFQLLNEIFEQYDLMPNFQILFLGDSAQLPPINEVLSKVATVNCLAELTEVMRYDGKILEYCTLLRTDRNFKMAHFTVDAKYPNDSAVLLMTEPEVMGAIADVFSSGETVRIFAATNARVKQLNTKVRQLITGRQDLYYQPGDVLLTIRPIMRAENFDGYAIGTNSKEKVDMQTSTSTLIQLGNKVVPGEHVVYGENLDIWMSKFETFTSPFGTTFKREAYRYIELDSDDQYNDMVVLLLDPNQVDLLDEETEKMRQVAKSTKSKGKGRKSARGQFGDNAKLAWEILQIKNWFEYEDGTPIELTDYRRKRTWLWDQYFALKGFADVVSYSYASTVHKGQGATIGVSILDMNDLTRERSRKISESEGVPGATWDTRKLIYTAATRASKQIVCMQT